MYKFEEATKKTLTLTLRSIIITSLITVLCNLLVNYFCSDMLVKLTNFSASLHADHRYLTGVAYSRF